MAASIGVAMLAEKILKRPGSGLIAGLIFAIHPAHPEAVAWVSGRFDVMCGAFLVWSLYYYILSTEAEKGSGSKWKIISLILFGLACLCKEQAFIFPLVIFLYELIPLPGNESRQPNLKSAFLNFTKFLIVTILLFAVRCIVIRGFGGFYPEEATTNLLP